MSASPSLAKARQGFTTQVAPRNEPKEPIPQPPPEVFSLVRYDSPVGKLGAYLTPNPNNGKKLPAIIWITGGDCNSINDLWSESDPENDQTAAAYRQAGIVMMFPSLRGGNDNPGVRESFYGEVDDVLAAADFLAKQDYVDPTRIYLGGHSTGGTLVLLVAEFSDRFRAVFSFGPVDNPVGYGPELTYFDANNPQEVRLRSPITWVQGIKSPTFVIEGQENPGNVDAVQAMAKVSTSPSAHFITVPKMHHFNILFPANRVIAQKILADNNPTSNLTLTAAELAGGGKQ